MTLTRTLLRAWAVLVLTVVAVLPARAGFMPISQPDAAYVMSTTLLPITDPDFSPVLALTNGTDTISFDIPMAALTVPTTWASWGSPPNTEGSTPRVLWTNGITSVTLTSANPLGIFGVEAGPNVPLAFPITADFFFGPNLVGSITRDVDGNGGALLFAASSTDPFDTVVISSPIDFAIAQVRVGQGPLPPTGVPEPSSLALLASAGLIGLAGWGRRAWRRLSRISSGMI